MSSERRTLYAITGLLVICLGWLTYYLSDMLRGNGVARPLDTPAWRMANDLTKKLVAQNDFSDVGVAVVSEKPMKFKVNGAVHSAADLEKLKDLIEQESPNQEFEFDVLVMGR